MKSRLINVVTEVIFSSIKYKTLQCDAYHRCSNKLPLVEVASDTPEEDILSSEYCKLCPTPENHSQCLLTAAVSSLFKYLPKMPHTMD